MSEGAAYVLGFLAIVGFAIGCAELVENVAVAFILATFGGLGIAGLIQTVVEASRNE